MRYLNFSVTGMRPLPEQPSLSSGYSFAATQQATIHSTAHSTTEPATAHHDIPYMQAALPNEEAKMPALELQHATHVVRNRAVKRNKHGFGSQTCISVQPLLIRCATLVMSLHLAKPKFLR